MNEAKVREVLDYVYNTAHHWVNVTTEAPPTNEEYYEALQDIEAKIEELTTDDLGEE